MIEQYVDIQGATKPEAVRAWCIQAAIEKVGDGPTRRGEVVKLAAEIEEFVLSGGVALTENTLRKANDALVQDSDLVVNEADAFAIINVLQNAGIVLRERV